MTVIRPNSVSGITSITAQANEINFFRSNGTLAGLQLNGVNFNTTTGVSTFNNLDVGGVLTYQDVTNVDSVGIITARSNIDCNGALDVDGQTDLDVLNVAESATFSDDVFINVRGKSFKTSDWSIFNTTSGNALAISGGNSLTERLRIKSDGKIQLSSATANTIHSSSDASKIAIFAGSTDSVSNGGVIAVTGVNHSAGCFTDVSAGTGGHIQFRTGTTHRLRITSTGKVGIGTDNPSQELTVYGADPIISVQEASASSQVDIGTGTVTGFINIQKADGTRTIQMSGSGDSYFTGGNMGLGVSPTYSGIFGGTQRTLHIGGTTAPCLRITSSTSGQADLVMHAGNSGRRVDIANMATNGYISIWTKPASGSIQERIKISPEGYVTKPAQAMFEAGGNNTAFSAQSPLPYPSIKYNIGGCYNNSTYKFTAPVNGYYQVMAHVIPTDLTATNSHNVELYVIDNHGTRYFLDRKLKSSNYASNNFSVGGTRVIYADANDTLWLQFHSISGTPKVETASYFSIMLVT